jgi:excisionase family DNA binding protein
MATRGRTELTKRSGRARERSLGSPPGPLVYTAQDVARFCEVDLKTIHNWTDAGKIPHHRTEGRHLRFRRNHVVAFLRAHDYPLPPRLANERPTILFALPDSEDHARGEIDEVVKKLESHFSVCRFETAMSALTQLALLEPDAIVLSNDDSTWARAPALAALKAYAPTSWVATVVIAELGSLDEHSADLVVPRSGLGRLPTELRKHLAIE